MHLSLLACVECSKKFGISEGGRHLDTHRFCPVIVNLGVLDDEGNAMGIGRVVTDELRDEVVHHSRALVGWRVWAARGGGPPGSTHGSGADRPGGPVCPLLVKKDAGEDSRGGYSEAASVSCLEKAYPELSDHHLGEFSLAHDGPGSLNLLVGAGFQAGSTSGHEEEDAALDNRVGDGKVGGHGFQQLVILGQDPPGEVQRISQAEL